MLKDLGESVSFFFFCLFDLPSESLKGKQLEIKVKEDKTWLSLFYQPLL